MYKNYSKSVLESMILQVDSSLKPDSSALVVTLDELESHFFKVGIPLENEDPHTLGFFESLIGRKKSDEHYQDRILESRDNLVQRNASQLDMVRLLVNEFINYFADNESFIKFEVGIRPLWALQNWVTSKDDLLYYLQSERLNFEATVIDSKVRLVEAVINMINLNMPVELFEIQYNVDSLYEEISNEVPIINFDRWLYDILKNSISLYFGSTYNQKMVSVVNSSLREFCREPRPIVVGLNFLAYLGMAEDDLHKFYRNYEIRNDVTSALARITREEG